MFAHWWELAIILLLALVFFGPKRLPEIGSSMGKGIKEFKKATTERDDDTPERDQARTPNQIPTSAQATQQNQTREPSEVSEPR